MTREDLDAAGNWYATGTLCRDGRRPPPERDHAHVEYAAASGIPVGLRRSVAKSPDELLRLDHILNPDNGRPHHAHLSPVGRPICPRPVAAIDPWVKRKAELSCGRATSMHGNTITSTSGYKTRRST